MRYDVRRHLAIALVLAAAGCASIPDNPETPTQAAERRTHAPRPAYNLAGYPPAARAGYIDGCESARHSEYAHKDAKRMADDPQYATAWNDGFSICGR
jgi:hypothetical protein